MVPIWGWQDPGGSHVGPTNHAIGVQCINDQCKVSHWYVIISIYLYFNIGATILLEWHMIWLKFGIEQELNYFVIPYFILGNGKCEGNELYAASFDGMNKTSDTFCRGWNL